MTNPEVVQVNNISIFGGAVAAEIGKGAVGAGLFRTGGTVLPR